MKLKNIKVGLGITGSFCNLKNLEEVILELKKEGATILPIISYSIKGETNRFTKPKEFIQELKSLTGNSRIIDTITKAEPIGPKKLIDIMVIAPCTGNTISKMANAITDTPVLMAAKSHLRNDKPVLIGISTNDALGNGAKNIGILLNSKNIFFVPFRQDDYKNKPKSLVYDYTKITDSILYSLQRKTNTTYNMLVIEHNKRDMVI